MLITNPAPVGGHRHNYVWLSLLVAAPLLFIGHIAIQQLAERGNNTLFHNTTLRAEEVVLNDITPSDWVYRALDALNYLWQLGWLLYALTFVFRRSTGGYLYYSPKTLTPTFYVIYILAFLIQTIWLLFFFQNYLVWTWVMYLVSFIFLFMALFIINNNLGLNKKIYEIEGFRGDIWCLQFLAQNGVAFFAAWTAIRAALALNTYLQIHVDLSMANVGSISLILAGLITVVFFLGSNYHTNDNEKSAYQFAPWIVFILFFWGVVENNWLPKNPTRNNIIAAVELIATLLGALAALALFSMRYRASKIDRLP